MRILIAHLSDIHFRDGANAVTGRRDELIAALRSETVGVDTAFIALTGDIAFSGKPAEYKEAIVFLRAVANALSDITSQSSPIVVASGNHDCNFDRNTTLRDALLSAASANLKSFDGRDPSLAEGCLVVQQDFLSFLREMDSAATETTPAGLIKYRREYSVGTQSIVFECLNTAWLSQKSEKQGRLVYPEGLLLETPPVADLVISLFHHPYNWLDPENARVFRRYIEGTSDIVLTGHEHQSDVYRRSAITGEEALYVEGAVLQSSDTTDSGFNVILIDLEKHLWKPLQFEWLRGDRLFKPRSRGDWRPFQRNTVLRRNLFTNSADYQDFLSDAGAGFTHPRVKTVSLDDIYVFPSIDEMSLEGRPDQLIEVEDVLGYVANHSKILFIGAERSGKTSLAKQIYKRFRKDNLVPVMVSGDQIRNPEPDAIQRLAAKQFEGQYASDLIEQYRQLDLRSKALIVDDFHRAPLNRAARDMFIANAMRTFDRVILLADEVFQLKELTYQQDEVNPLLSFRCGTLREFGHARRGDLIEKWHTLGTDYSVSEEEIAHRIETAERSVDTLLGKNVVPAYPIFVLSFLQALESQTPLSTAAGSYGHIYEALITAALSKDEAAGSLDTKYTYISRLAFFLFDSNQSVLTADALEKIAEDYFRDYKIRILTHAMLRDLQNSSILRATIDGYVFKYKYLYYYFVARYLQENISAGNEVSKLRGIALGLTDRVYNEDAANILIFFIYLTKDSEVIGRMITKTREVFSEIPPCEMNADVKFITDSGKEPPRLTYYETEPREAKRKYRQSLDRVERLTTPDDTPELNDVWKLNLAFKTLQIMGQILRNFPGSLRGDMKLEIARESYLLGLRTLTIILAALHVGKEILEELFKGFLRDKRGITDEKELERRSEQFCYLLMFGAGAQIVRAISSAVGSENLRETYKEVVGDNQTPAFRLVDIAIKLDHFRPVPRNEVIDLSKALAGHTYALTVLQRLVLDFLNLYPTDYKTRQMLCRALGVVMKPRALERETQR